MRKNRLVMPAGIWILLWLCLWTCTVSHAAEDAETIAPKDVATCLGCHEDNPNKAHLTASAHGKLVCQTCHKGVDRFPHPEKAMATKPTCASCHAGEAGRLSGSMHRKLNDVKSGMKTACQVCHPGPNSHEITPLKRTGDRSALCKGCHTLEAQTVVTSVHQGTRIGSDCLSCHNNNPHNVQSIHGGGPAQVIATCQQCHAKEARGLARGAHGTGMAKKIGVNCLTCHGDNPHTITTPKVIGSTVCRQCHIDLGAQVDQSAHGSANAHAKHINCETCHGKSVHAVASVAPKTPKEKSALCQKCHAQLSDTLVHNIHKHLDAKARAKPLCTDCHGANLHTVTPGSQMTPQNKEATCIQCHQNISNMVENSIHVPKGGKDQFQYCTGCHASNRSLAAVSQASKLKKIASPNTVTTLRVESANGSEGLSLVKARDHVVVTSENYCRDCHKENAALPGHSRHDRVDKVPGDHPTCFTCHGGNAHDMVKPKKLSARETVQLCMKCHNNEELMKRYGMTTEPVHSYLKSFHGKAVMRFGQMNAATCVDCHGLHAVLPPNDKQSPVNSANVTGTCRKCHPNAKMNFSLSGANHITLKIDETPTLRTEELFFKVLTVSVILGLILLIMLDLRRKVFSRDYHPESGRPVGLLISLAFFAMMIGIAMMSLGIRGARWPVITSLGLGALALLMYAFTRQPKPPHIREKVYPRFNLMQRLQHICLMGSFTILVITGMPLRFAEITWAPNVQALFGGFAGARLAHRGAALVMIITWIWHTLYLIYQWKLAKFSFKSWTMFPNLQDFTDFFHTVAYGVGLRNDPPKFDRFQFREKFDYFAVYWGMPIMVFSGLVLWFPAQASAYLSNLSFGVAYIAHSDESVLAMLAIVIWHFYNTHFNPDTFPMNRTWLTGTMTESEMERDHPMEKARIDAAQRDT